MLTVPLNIIFLQSLQTLFSYIKFVTLCRNIVIFAFFVITDLTKKTIYSYFAWCDIQVWELRVIQYKFRLYIHRALSLTLKYFMLNHCRIIRRRPCPSLQVLFSVPVPQFFFSFIKWPSVPVKGKFEGLCYPEPQILI